MITATPAQAGNYSSCHSSSCVPTFIISIFHSPHPGTPDPTWRGVFISHFDSDGVPQSLITQAETYTVVTDVPCPPESKKRSWSWVD